MSFRRLGHRTNFGPGPPSVVTPTSVVQGRFVRSSSYGVGSYRVCRSMPSAQRGFLCRCYLVLLALALLILVVFLSARPLRPIPYIVPALFSEYIQHCRATSQVIVTCFHPSSPPPPPPPPASRTCVGHHSGRGFEFIQFLKRFVAAVRSPRCKRHNGGERRFCSLNERTLCVS